ncbi:hypothetical protein CU098_011287 [Rhizopus stolonifer]|uniref:PH domain-containing protein n=1 Tax=Rhizopus stolonifer TaxID=4846 RepID=A0A367KSJ8_RHIST|nr:hypothetical protein CU098_011287 [Rhizopus stolonifer]
MSSPHYYPPRSQSYSNTKYNNPAKLRSESISAISTMSSSSSTYSHGSHLLNSQFVLSPTSEYPRTPSSYLTNTTGDYDGAYPPSTPSEHSYYLNTPLPRPSDYSHMARSPPHSMYGYDVKNSYVVDEESSTFGPIQHSLSSRTSTSAASDTIFPPTEAMKLKSNAALLATEASFKVVYAGDATYKPDKGILSKSKRAHFVLTNNHLLVYKSSQKARSEINIFDHHNGEGVSKEAMAKIFDKDRILLKLSSVYAIQLVATAACVFRIEYFHPQSGQALSHTLTVDTDKECKQWVQALRKSVRIHHTRIEIISPTERFTVLERLVKQSDTFTKSDQVKMFKVVFKEKRYKVGGDLPKEVFLPVIMAIGKFSFYFLPISILDDEYLKTVERDRFGFLSLLSVRYENVDDTVILEIKQVGKSNRQLVFASTFCEDIIQYLYRGMESLVPGSASQLYADRVPAHIKQTQVMPLDIPADPEDEVSGHDDKEIKQFNTTLRAYCAAMNMNKSRFNYTITGPLKNKTFTLLPPNEIGQTPAEYEKYELLAIFRTIQANNIFIEVCFANRSLHTLETWKLQPNHGWSFNKHHPLKDENLLSNELYTILTNLKLLRKLDLTNCSIGKPSEELMNRQSSAIATIGIVMRSGKTHLSRVCLGKNIISEQDLGRLVQGIREHKKSIKELYLNECGLQKNMIELVLKTLYEKTPEQIISLDLSTEKPMAIDPVLIEKIVPTFKRLEYLRMRGYHLLSRSYRFMLESSRLRELDLGGSRMDADTVTRLCKWMQTPSFQSIEALHLGDCNLNGKNVYDILICISQSANRSMHLNLENNPIMKEVMHLPKLHSAILQGEGPKSISFARIEWDDSTLREFIDCLRDNQIITHLDLSDISIRDTEELSVDTVRMLTSLFERNTCITELELNLKHNKLPISALSSIQPKSLISYAVVQALQGLRHNSSLQHLDISGLNIEDAGAFALSRVLKTNKTLQSIIIEENNASYRSILKSIEESAKQVINLPLPRVDIRNQLRYLVFRIEELILSENEAQFFLIHTTASDKKKLKKHELEMIIQERKACEIALKNLEIVVHSLMVTVRKNMREYEEQTYQTMEFQLQAQNAAQELAIAQVRLQNRPANAIHARGRYPSSSGASTTSSTTSSVVGSLSRSVSRNTYYPHPNSRRELDSGYIHGQSLESFVTDDPGFISDFGYVDDFEHGGLIDPHFSGYHPKANSTSDQDSIWNEEQIVQRLNNGLYLPPDERV